MWHALCVNTFDPRKRKVEIGIEKILMYMHACIRQEDKNHRKDKIQQPGNLISDFPDF